MECLLPCERAYKVGLETGVKSDLAFCLGPFTEKTNSEVGLFIKPISGPTTVKKCLKHQLANKFTLYLLLNRYMHVFYLSGPPNI